MLAAAIFAYVTAAAPAPVQNPDRVVAITIDDLPATLPPGSDDWAGITWVHAALKRHEVRAVGFVNERKLYANDTLDSTRVALLEAWLAAGHELGNHTFAHRSAHFTPLREYLEEIERGELVTRVLAARAGRPLRYFRHPQLHTGRSLAYRHAVERFLAAHHYVVAPVTVDNQEWMYAHAYDVAGLRRDTSLTRRVLSDYKDHLDTVLDRLTNRGYRFVPLEAAFADSAYRSTDTYVGPMGLSWLIRWALSRGLHPPAEPRELPYIRGLQTVGGP